MTKIEQTLDSREVAEMVGKEHKELLRDIRRYCNQLSQSKIALPDFFTESEYENRGKKYPCYRITKKGCEFIARKLTGTKGTIFTARYINKFHEMKDRLESQNGNPWYVRELEGKKIVLFRDFKTLTGVELFENYTALKRPDHLVIGLDYNGYGWKYDREKFMEEHGFDFGEDDCMRYLYMRGFQKALWLIEHEDNKEEIKRIARQLRLECGEKEALQVEEHRIEKKQETVPIQINVVLDGKRIQIS